LKSWKNWPPIADFTNILQAAFMSADPKSKNRYWQLDWDFMLLASACVKAVLEMLVKLTPIVDFTNIYEQILLAQIPKAKNRYWQLDCVFTILASARVKAVL
jgi:hypothetical protein